MVTRADAPPAGWYPDPTGRHGLLWWDGEDWTHHRRPSPPTAADLGQRPQDAPVPARDGPQGVVPTATQLRSRASSVASDVDVADVVAEARRAARAEVDRAVREARDQLSVTRAEWQPRLEAFARRAKRWLRVALLVAVLGTVLWLWANARLQVGLLEWLGDRVDAVTATVVAADARPWPVGPDDR